MKPLIKWAFRAFALWAIIEALLIADALHHDFPDASFWVRWSVVAIVLAVAIVWFRAKCKHDHEAEMDDMAEHEKEKMK